MKKILIKVIIFGVLLLMTEVQAFAFNIQSYFGNNEVYFILNGQSSDGVKGYLPAYTTNSTGSVVYDTVSQVTGSVFNFLR